jgi:GntR family histidine utilization transcriptional repressor
MGQDAHLISGAAKIGKARMSRPSKRAVKRLPAGAVAEPPPVYRAIKETIVAAIKAGALKPGDRVASENELVHQFGVSRMTANRALRELAHEGLVNRIRGVGSFVSETPLHTDFLAVRHIADEIRQRGRVYGSRLIVQDVVAAIPEVAEALGIPAGSSVFHTLIVHTQDNTPVQVEDRFVTPTAAPDFLSIDFGMIYPGTYLHSVAPTDEVEHIVEAILAARRERDYLGISSGEPCLRLVRRTWSRGQIVSCIWFTFPGRFYRLKARFPLKTKHDV